MNHNTSLLTFNGCLAYKGKELDSACMVLEFGGVKPVSTGEARVLSQDYYNKLCIANNIAYFYRDYNERTQ